LERDVISIVGKHGFCFSHSLREYDGLREYCSGIFSEMYGSAKVYDSIFSDNFLFYYTDTKECSFIIDIMEASRSYKNSEYCSLSSVILE